MTTVHGLSQLSQVVQADSDYFSKSDSFALEGYKKRYAYDARGRPLMVSIKIWSDSPC